ncbi:uncharacterized protein STEHIDRAFT_106463 [Stereum hirsutum FP-91666 SS1]|uniref:uncharacterized protein n=1 Tax=Stereum hirsutum (strain FP-91666) TaxID=721885 RepID=UPI000440C31C|nr:uncharacterized protein STEHIDRAFT_106463 [Stereum hirsutum FP-91666 SS1]EIM91742.1 hypothetical protein STEHIDRAFT_106463 [Stereum hirsutum FP-91666 SS1]
MALLSLPNEIIRYIALYFLEEWSNPEHSKTRPIAPVSFDVNLRNVCSTNQRLRDVCRSLLYRNAWVSICGIRSMDSQQVHISRKLFSNKELCGLVRLQRRHARLRDNVRGNHDPITATAPDARHPPIRQIIQDLISALPNLISLDILGTFFALSSDILVTINAHPNLKTVTLEDAYQIHTLPLTSANSLGRICCRHFRLPPSAWQTMPQYFLQDGGARLDSLYLSRSTLEELGDCTLSGLRSIVLPAPTDLFPSPDAASAIVARHSSLESITLRGASSLNLRSLSCLPCFSEMFVEAKDRGLHSAFQCEEVELSRDPYNGFAATPAWSIVGATLRLTSQSSAGLPLFLKFLSSIRRLSIIKTSVEDDVFSVVYSFLDCRNAALSLTDILLYSKTSSLSFTPTPLTFAISRHLPSQTFP